MLIELVLVLAVIAVTMVLVLYLRTQSLRQFERACQARMDALRSAAELREITARTGRKLRDAAMEEVARGRGGR
ncbi:MAG TPA: hypothetical protein VNQ77_15105 [Frankiaceae bacterium]|nr:hypothetical protein [Frankiaceae bacterium]